MSRRQAGRIRFAAAALVAGAVALAGGCGDDDSGDLDATADDAATDVPVDAAIDVGPCTPSTGGTCNVAKQCGCPAAAGSLCTIAGDGSLGPESCTTVTFGDTLTNRTCDPEIRRCLADHVCAIPELLGWGVAAVSSSCGGGGWSACCLRFCQGDEDCAGLGAAWTCEFGFARGMEARYGLCKAN